MRVVVGTNKNKREELRKEGLAYRKDVRGNRCTRNGSDRRNEMQKDERKTSSDESGDMT